MLAFGCSAIELVRHPALFVAPLLDELDQRRALLSREPLFRTAAGDLDAVRLEIRSGARLFESGAICRGSQTFDQALQRLTAADSSLARTIDQRAKEIGIARAAALRRTGQPDVSRDDLRIGWMELERALVGDTLADTRITGQALSRTCAAIRSPLNIRGRVQQTDDAAGMIRLRGGRLIGLAARSYQGSAAVGTMIVATGVTFADGTSLANTLQAPSASDPAPPGASPCLDLRIAPIQPMEPFHPGPATLHMTRAYRSAGDVHQLEYGMRLAVKKTGSCPGVAADGRALFYGMKIDVEQGALKETLATDLRDAGGSIGFPDFLEVTSPTNAILETAVFRTKCQIFPGNNKICDPPQQLSTKTYTILVRPLGAYSSASALIKEFSVRDDGVAGDFEPMNLSGYATSDVNASTTFQAQGYTVNGNVSSKPQLMTIGIGQPYAVYNDDFYNPNIDYVVDQVLMTGQDKPSALRWARVTGTRNGSPFWYSTSLPKIVRDRVAACPSSAPGAVLPTGPPNPNSTDPSYPTYPPKAVFTMPSVKDTYYKLPYAAGTGLGHGYLNIDDSNPPSRHPEWQAYALDLSAGFGTTIVAARGGIVRFLQESDPYTLGDPAKLPPGALAAPAGWWGNGNKIYIEHEDGTYGVYYHFVVNSILPVIGEHVRRGQPLAQEGQTGGASGPHVHFEVDSTFDPANISTEPWGEVRIRFEATVITSLGSPPAVNPCYIPRNSDLVFASTNPAPTPD